MSAGSAVAAMLGGAAIADAGLYATLSMIVCVGDKTWESNTGLQRLVVSVFYDLGPAASVVGNVGIAAVVFACHSVMMLLLRRYMSKKNHFCSSSSSTVKKAAVRLRYPSISIQVACFLLPGTLFASISSFGSSSPMAPTATPVGIVAGVAGLLLCLAFVAVVSWYARQYVWRRLKLISTYADYRRHLPRWFLTCFGMMLSRTKWGPKSVKATHSVLFAVAGSTNALVVMPLVQFHGAIFSLIAALPIQASLCSLQLALLIAWLLVKVCVLLWWRLQLLQRPISNVLGLLDGMLAIALLSANIDQVVDGPGDSLAAVLDVLSWLLAVVRMIAASSSLVAAAADQYTSHVIHSRYVNFNNGISPLSQHSDDGAANGSLSLPSNSFSLSQRPNNESMMSNASRRSLGSRGGNNSFCSREEIDSKVALRSLILLITRSSVSPTAGGGDGGGDRTATTVLYDF